MADDPIEEVEKTTKDPEHVAPKEVEVVTPPPVQNPEHAHDSVKATVDGLVEKVATLEGAVAALTPQVKDETPTRRPWTHRRF